MDARLEASIVDALERSAAGERFDEDRLRVAYPEHWRGVRDFLAFEARVASGAPTGSCIGPYRLLRRLGRGGMGTVYLARAEVEVGPVAAGTLVALKRIHPHLARRPGFTERALAEARAAAAIDHENVVRTLDSGVADGSGGPVAYVATEHVDGQSLRGLLDELGPLGEPLVRHVAAEILRGLHAIHAAGVLHGDLKPENVLVAAGDSVRVVDVGGQLAVRDAADDVPAGFRGTILYAAPEQFGGGPVDARADLHALGTLVDELLTGARPLSGRVPDRRACRPSPFLRAFAAKLRAARPDDRFATAAEAMDVLLAGESSAWWLAHPWAAAADARIDCRSGGARITRLVGREREMGVLRGLLADASAGRGCAALVVGDSGVGKTRLVEELAADARREQVRVVGCSFGGAAAAADRASDAVRALLAAEPEDSSALLVVAEDLHAAPDADRELVARLVADSARSRTLVVATARRVRAESLRTAFPQAALVDLANLSVEAVAALLSDVLCADDLADRLAPDVVRRTEGNPLGVLELLDALRDAGVLVAAPDGSWSLREARGGNTPAAPMSPRALLALRIQAIPRADRELLEAAACIGLRFDPSLLARVLSRDPGRVLLRLVRLERREHLVRTTGDGVEFEHREVLDAALDQVTPERARATHAAVAAAIESLAGPRGGPSAREAAEILHHALRGGDGPRAARHAERAIESLLRSGRQSEAIALATDALETEGAAPGRLRAEVRMLRARGLATAGRIDEAHDDFVEAAREAESCGDGTASRRARRSVAECHTMRGRPDEARALAESVLAECVAAGDLVEEPAAHMCLGLALGRMSRFDEAVAEMRRFVAARRRSPDQSLDGEAEYFLGESLLDAGALDDALDAVTSAIGKLRTGAGGSQVLVWALSCRGAVLGRLGRRDESVDVLADGVRLARSTGNVRMESMCRSHLAEQLRIAGRIHEATAHVERSVELAPRSGHLLHEHHCSLRCAAHLAGLGRTAESLAEADRALSLAVRARAAPGRVRTLALVAWLHERWGDVAESRSAVERAAEAAAESGSQVLGELFARVRAVRGQATEPTELAAGDAAASSRILRLGGDATVLLPDLARIDRADDAVRSLREIRAVCARHQVANAVIECDARLAARGDGDPGEVGARLVAGWEGLSLFPRIAAATRLAAAGVAGLVDRAAEDVEFAVVHAPRNHASALRRALERLV